MRRGRRGEWANHYAVVPILDRAAFDPRPRNNVGLAVAELTNLHAAVAVFAAGAER